MQTSFLDNAPTLKSTSLLPSTQYGSYPLLLGTSASQVQLSHPSPTIPAVSPAHPCGPDPYRSWKCGERCHCCLQPVATWSACSAILSLCLKPLFTRALHRSITLPASSASGPRSALIALASCRLTICRSRNSTSSTTIYIFG